MEKKENGIEDQINNLRISLEVFKKFAGPELLPLNYYVDYLKVRLSLDEGIINKIVSVCEVEKILLVTLLNDIIERKLPEKHSWLYEIIKDQDKQRIEFDNPELFPLQRRRQAFSRVRSFNDVLTEGNWYSIRNVFDSSVIYGIAPVLNEIKDKANIYYLSIGFCLPGIFEAMLGSVWTGDEQTKIAAMMEYEIYNSMGYEMGGGPFKWFEKEFNRECTYLPDVKDEYKHLMNQ